MRYIFLFIFIFLCLGLTYFIFQRFKEDKYRRMAQADLRRLALATDRIFSEKRIFIAADFWRELGRAPLKDPWGGEYLLELRNTQEYFWKSSGPDRASGTLDDLVEPVLWGASPESGQKDMNDNDRVNDAK